MSQKTPSKLSAVDRTPYEIWSSILEPYESKLPAQSWVRPVTSNDPENTKTLASVSRVSRAAHPHANQLLYRTLDLQSLKTPRVSAVLLLRALADEPSLGESVQELRLNCSKLVASGNAEVKWDELFKSMQSRINAPGLTGEVRDCLRKWLESTKKTKDFSEMATAFVCLLPNLRVLECELKSRDPLVGYFKNMSSLTEVRLRATNDTQLVSIVEILKALRHPTLEVVRLEGFGSDRAFGSNLTPNSNVETVDLRDSYLNIGGTAGIFQLFPNIKNLSYEFASPQRMKDYSRSHIQMRDLGYKLRTMGKNLESLTIDTVVLSSFSGEDNSFIRSLQGMKLLKHLVACNEFLPSWHELPSGLESIHFLPESRAMPATPYVDEGFFDLIKDSLLDNGSKFPSLKKVSVELINPEAQVRDEDWNVINHYGEWQISRKQERIPMAPSAQHDGKLERVIVEFSRP
ncbi:unnamed protein product [Clonostachys rosea]|uniref:F-box domain-containing protein n=1 Tax=Bionectria ochroleuca TaxID=29856 RepID=A0ABY6TTQ1_BIOOC|nr:unnamed protein product [Clonostachys rosea]